MKKAIDGKIKIKRKKEREREDVRRKRETEIEIQTIWLEGERESGRERDKLFNMFAYHSIDLLMPIVINISTYNNKRQISISQ